MLFYPAVLGRRLFILVVLSKFVGELLFDKFVPIELVDPVVELLTEFEFILLLDPEELLLIVLVLVIDCGEVDPIPKLPKDYKLLVDVVVELLLMPLSPLKSFEKLLLAKPEFKPVLVLRVLKLSPIPVKLPPVTKLLINSFGSIVGGGLFLNVSKLEDENLIGPFTVFRRS
jgi:hypothetical protein